MQYRRFGRTDLSVPVFSCGGMRYQHSWKDTSLQDIPAANQRNLEATIRRSLEVGIHHIETARGYGTSESQLGQILPRLPREKLIVQTKVAPKANPQDFRANLERSLAELQLDTIDLLGIHGINTDELLDQTVRPRGCLEVVRQFQSQGRIRFVGFSTHGPTEVIQRAIATDAFDYVNLHWYYVNQTNWPAIEAAHHHDMGVFIISPSDKGGKLYDPPPRLVELCAPLSPMVFNDLFCLSHLQVHTLSLGAARPSDFDEHLQVLEWLDRPQDVLPNILQRLEQVAIDRFGQYFGDAEFGETWYRTWGVGLPSHRITPGNINVRVMVWLWNLVQAFDLVAYGKERYNLLGNGGHWFPGQPLSGINPKRLQPYLQSSPHKELIPRILVECDRLLGNQPAQRLSQS